MIYRPPGVAPHLTLEEWEKTKEAERMQELDDLLGDLVYKVPPTSSTASEPAYSAGTETVTMPKAARPCTRDNSQSHPVCSAHRVHQKGPKQTDRLWAGKLKHQQVIANYVKNAIFGIGAYL